MFRYHLPFPVARASVRFELPISDAPGVGLKIAARLMDRVERVKSPFSYSPTASIMVCLTHLAKHLVALY